MKKIKMKKLQLDYLPTLNYLLNKSCGIGGGMRRTIERILDLQLQSHHSHSSMRRHELVWHQYL